MSLLYKPSKPLSRGQMAALLAMLMTIMPFSIDAYLPALLDIAAGLNADIHQVEKSLSSFMLGVAAGQLIGGSLSDIKGRRNIALGGLSIYVLASAALVFVQTADQLLVWRMVQALGAGMSAVVAGAVVRDNYQGREAAKMFALIGIIVMTAPLIAPLFGSLLHSVAGWRSIFAFLFAYAALVVFLLYRFLPQFKAAEPITKTQLLHIGTRYRNVFRNRAALGFLFDCVFERIAVCLHETVRPVAASICLCIRLQHHHHDELQPAHRFRPEPRLGIAPFAADGHIRPVFRQHIAFGNGIMVKAACTLAGAAPADVFRGRAGLNRRQYAGAVHGQFQTRNRRQRQCRADGFAVADCLHRGLCRDLAAQRQHDRDGHLHVRLQRHRRLAAVVLFAPPVA